MKIVPIFEDQLYSIRYDNESTEEFNRIFECWQDPQFLEEFFYNNESDLKSGFFGSISIEEAIHITRNGALKLRRRFKEICDAPERSLDDIFAPLSDGVYEMNFEKRKAKADWYKNWLRVYAIRIDPGVFLITGGAIKLTKQMSAAAHTKTELIKMKRCLDYLNEQSILDIEGFIELADE
jgi:hypothetical protein